jgi:creatinine amidohydrolase
MERFPVGKLPEIKLMTQRDEKEIELVLKGPLNGGKHIYTIAWPS